MNIEEFVEQYCSNADNTVGTPKCSDSLIAKKKTLVNLLYGGNCQGSKEFQTFFFNQNSNEKQKSNRSKKRKSSGSKGRQ